MSRIYEASRRVGTSRDVASSARADDAVFSAEEFTREAPPRDRVEFRPAVQASSIGFSQHWREHLARAPEGNPALVEQFRRLAATLHHAQAASGIHLVMVTSAAPDDGKTLTAVNLALVLSESYRRRVLLVDADLRRPSIPDVVDFSEGPGLSDILRAGAEQKPALVQLTPTLMLLPAGQPMPDPIGVLTSPRMRHLLEEAAAGFDWVILDAPPVGPLADAGLLAEMVDGTLLVVRAARTQHPHVQKAIEAVGRERILGVVLNALTHMPYQPYEQYYTGGNLAQRAEKVDRR